MERLIRCKCPEQRGIVAVQMPDGSIEKRVRGKVLRFTVGIADLSCRDCGFSMSIALDTAAPIALS